jgi:hypothetical protein
MIAAGLPCRMTTRLSAGMLIAIVVIIYRWISSDDTDDTENRDNRFPVRCRIDIRVFFISSTLPFLFIFAETRAES